MRFAVATLGLAVAALAPAARAQTCSGVSGPFTLSDVTGTCTYARLLDEFGRQVYGAKGATAAACAAGDGSAAKADFDAKLVNATGAATGEEAGALLCKKLYDEADVTPFTNAADKGDDLHFEQMFYNGLSDWQDEVETLYEPYGGGASSVLQEDARKVKEFYQGEGQYSRVAWPDALTNFEASTCSAHAAMCCWPKDRQANDGNGNCAKPYDHNCVDKDVADNTDLLFADLDKGGDSSGFASDRGFAVYPEDNGNGEGSIHCHGFAWADDEYDPTSRYKANNLFFVSMYDHMHQRGYVKNIPGMPMCGCLDQMPLVTRSDCTQVDLTEDWEVNYDGDAFTLHMTKVEVDFNACQGRDNNNNNLWAYAARLFDEGKMTRHEFGKVGRALTNHPNNLDFPAGRHATNKAKHDKGFVVGHAHDEATWTHVAGRDALWRGEPYGRNAFNKALAGSVTPDFPVVLRVCPHCTRTHQYVYYRRLTAIPGGHDVLHYILRWTSGSPPGGNKWNVDFTLHSTYEDAQSGESPWGCQNNSFNYRRNFVGDCSPSGARVQNQYSNFAWFPGPQPDVAYYVNKPQGEGLQDYIDSGTVRANGETDIDIGNAGKVGNTLEDNGVYHITGAGSDIWGYSDSFHYMSQPWSGDIDVKVRMSEFTNNPHRAYSKGGIMLRSDNSNDATFVANFLSYSRGVYFQHRRSKGNHANQSANYWRTNPVQKVMWLRLVKKQQTIEFYTATDEAGEVWTLRATDTVFFPNEQYRVGLALTSQDPNYLAEATFDGYEIQDYQFPTSAPSISSAPSSYDPVAEIETQRTGTYAESNGVATLSGSGSDLWGRNDSFFFVGAWRDAASDFAVEAYIQKFDNWHLNSRGGLMIRDSLAPDAANAFVGAAGARQGAVFQSRAAEGQKTKHHQMIWANSNNFMYVRLVKAGTEITASFRATDADPWTVLGSTELTFTGSRIYVGQAVTAGRDYSSAIETLETRDYAVVEGG